MIGTEEDVLFPVQSHETETDVTFLAKPIYHTRTDVTLNIFNSDIVNVQMYVFMTSLLIPKTYLHHAAQWQPQF